MQNARSLHPTLEFSCVRALVCRSDQEKMVPEEARSLERITVRDLTQLARIAAADRQAFFAKQPKWAKLAERVVCVALCQGAALHFIDGRNGVKDFDVWTF